MLSRYLNRNYRAYVIDCQEQKIKINDFVAYNLGELVAKAETKEGLLSLLESKDIESEDCLVLKVMPKIRVVGKSQPRIRVIGKFQNRISQEYLKIKLVDKTGDSNNFKQLEFNFSSS